MNSLLSRLKLGKLGNIQVDKKKAAVIGFLCLVLIYIDFSFIMKMQAATLASLGKKLAKLKTDLGSLNKDLLAMQEIQQKQAQGGAEASLHARRFISEEEVVSLLQDISDIARNNNVQVTQMKPYNEPSVKQDKTPVSKFTPVLIALELSCDYHDLGRFINDLENGQIFVCLQELKLSSQQKEPARQKANLVLKTHVRTYAKK